MTSPRYTALGWALAALLVYADARAQTGAELDPWAPGARYREYAWVTPDTGEAFLRVGGEYGYAETPGKFPAALQDGDALVLPGALALEGATAATFTLEKVLSHEDSRDLRVAFNDNAEIAVPEPAAVPEPQTDYMYHTDVTVDVPLDHLRPGPGNRFTLRVDTAQRWGWPQNVFYAATLRVYYPDDTTALPRVAVADATLAPATALRLAAVGPGDERADYVFLGEDVDWSGRGIARRTHWQTFRAEPHHTPGTSTDAEDDFAVTWDTEWLPDQTAPPRLQARVRDADGVYRVGEPTGPLALAPRDYRVALLTSAPAPPNWVTRADTFAQAFTNTVDPGRVTAYRLHWTSWSPCYANGLTLNGHLLWTRTDDCYAYATHAPAYTSEHDLHFLEAGTNTLATALTPLVRGQMVHGMEVQWPGIQVAIKYE